MEKGTWHFGLLSTRPSLSSTTQPTEVTPSTTSDSGGLYPATPPIPCLFGSIPYRQYAGNLSFSYPIYYPACDFSALSLPGISHAQL